MPAELHVTADGFAALVGITSATVRAKARTGLLRPSAPDQFPVAANVRLYCEELRDAAGRHGRGRKSPGRDRLTLAQAEAAELKVAALKGRLLDARAVEAEWSDLVRTLRAGMLALSSRLGARLPALSRAEVEAIDDEVRRLLTTMGEPELEPSDEDLDRLAEALL